MRFFFVNLVLMFVCLFFFSSSSSCCYDPNWQKRRHYLLIVDQQDFALIPYFLWGARKRKKKHQLILVFSFVIFVLYHISITLYPFYPYFLLYQWPLSPFLSRIYILSWYSHVLLELPAETLLITLWINDHKQLPSYLMSLSGAPP